MSFYFEYSSDTSVRGVTVFPFIREYGISAWTSMNWHDRHQHSWVIVSHPIVLLCAGIMLRLKVVQSLNSTFSVKLNETNVFSNAQGEDCMSLTNNNFAYGGKKAGGERPLVVREGRDSQNSRISCLNRTNRNPSWRYYTLLLLILL